MNKPADVFTLPYWSATPDAMRERIIELVRQGKSIEAIKEYKDFHGIQVNDAKMTVVELHRLFVWPGPPTPCPHCGEALRTPVAQQCLSCSADWHPR
jgi:hypothetical protein